MGGRDGTVPIIYRAIVEDGTHCENFEKRTPLSIARLQATLIRFDIAADLLQDLALQSKQEILSSYPWKCRYCNKAARKLLNNAAMFLHVPPPDGPFIQDMVFPYCEKGSPCEEAGRREAASMGQMLGWQDVHHDIR